MLFSTTSTLEGWTIEEYLGTIGTHAVLGTGLFTDIASSFSDMFGTRSGAYADKLDELERYVFEQLTKKALARHASAVIGLRVDYDEVGASGKSMLMVTARGTAVVAVNSKGGQQRESTSSISDRELDIWLERSRLLALAHEGRLPLSNSKTWDFISEQRVTELAPFILRQCDPESVEEAAKRIAAYLETLPTAASQSALYLVISEGKQRPVKLALSVMSLIKGFDAEATTQLLQSDNFNSKWAAIQCLNSRQPAYTPEDLPPYRRLLDALSSCEFAPFPTRPKKGMLGGTKQIWTCPRCGNEESEGVQCQDGCWADNRGFRTNDLQVDQAIETVRLRIATLESVFQV